MRRLLVLIGALCLCGVAVGSSARAAGSLPIAAGDLIVSLGSGQVDEYTPSGQFVQTLMDSSEGLGLPTGAAFDGSGNLYVTDFANNQILKREAGTGTVSVFANSSSLGNGHVLNSPESIAFNLGYSKMYVSDANRDGPGGGLNVIDTATGSGTDFYALPSSNGSEGLGESDWLAFDANSNLYMTNENPSQGVMKVDQTTGDIVQPSLAANLPNDGYALSFDKNGNLWLGATDRIMEFDPTGALINTITNLNFSLIFAAVFNPAGDEFYAGDLNTGDVYTYSLDGTLQSTFNVGSGVDGLAVAGAGVPPNPPPNLANRYVALGDSIPYGHGLSNPYPNPQIGLPSNDVSQAPAANAYPGILASDLKLSMATRSGNCNLTGDDLAVSGAVAATADSTPGNDQCPQDSSNVTVQGDELAAANLQSNPAQLVTVQAGADDINFANCLLWETSKIGPKHFAGTQCVNGATVTSAVNTQLGHVRTATAHIIEQAAPYTRTIAVLNYYDPVPRPQDFKNASIFPGGKVDPVCWGLSHNEKGAYNDSVIIQTALNRAIANGVSDAEDAGVNNVTLVDISDLERTHEMCTGSPALFSGEPMPKTQFYSDLAHLAIPGNHTPYQTDLHNHAWRAAHPNRFGEQDIAKAVEGYVGP